MGFFRGYDCDKCGRGVQYADTGMQPKDWMRYKGRQEGWTFGKQVLCPSCQPHRKRKHQGNQSS